MLPLYDENPTRNFPLVTVWLIGINIVVFMLELGDPRGAEAVFDTFGLIPYELFRSPVTAYPTVFSAMFMHAGLMHLAGNMLYLWIFGNNIEDVLGKFKFLLFYLITGVIAAASHIATDLDSTIPMVGASGAVSGVLGAYLVLFPHARVRTLIFLGFFISVVRLPAIVLLGIWILMQLANNMMTPAGEAEVAFMAHIGGFAAGMILIFPFKSMK